MLKIEGDLVEAIFIKRLNRFLAEISLAGKIVLAHVPNTGRMKEFLTEGNRVIIREIYAPHRKTHYDLLMVYHGNLLINIDSKLPNTLLEQAFKENSIRTYEGYTHVVREVKFGNSRLDMAVDNGSQMALVEAKCVTYVTDHVASFPDAPTERGRKHILELKEALKDQMRAAVIFIIQREDAISFTPNRERDPKFADAVMEAAASGVEFYAYICSVTPTKIQIKKEIPILLG